MQLSLSSHTSVCSGLQVFTVTNSPTFPPDTTVPAKTEQSTVSKPDDVYLHTEGGCGLKRSTPYIKVDGFYSSGKMSQKDSDIVKSLSDWYNDIPTVRILDHDHETIKRLVVYCQQWKMFKQKKKKDLRRAKHEPTRNSLSPPLLPVQNWNLPGVTRSKNYQCLMHWQS